MKYSTSIVQDGEQRPRCWKGERNPKRFAIWSLLRGSHGLFALFQQQGVDVAHFGDLLLQNGQLSLDQRNANAVLLGFLHRGGKECTLQEDAGWREQEIDHKSTFLSLHS